MVSYTFGPGMLGLTLMPWDAETQGAVAVTRVREKSQAERGRLPVGAVIIALNGVDLPVRMRPFEVARRIRESTRPLKLVARINVEEAPPSASLGASGAAARHGRIAEAQQEKPTQASGEPQGTHGVRAADEVSRGNGGEDARAESSLHVTDNEMEAEPEDGDV